MQDHTNGERRHPRVAVGVPARISTIDAETDPDSGRRFFRASHEICTNLSRGGVFIRTADPPEAGHRLVVELELPGGRPFQAIGRVAWVTKRLGGEQAGQRGVGVQFLGGAPDQFTSLESYLSAARRKPSRAAKPKRRPKTD